MKLIDVTTRNAKELATMKRKVAAWLKAHKNGCNIGDTTWEVAADGKTYLLQVDNDGQLGQDLDDIIKNSASTKNISVKEYKGSYDWASDTYARPASVVSFTF
jgi:hypothetical protein